MVAVNNEFYRFCLSFPNEERQATGTLWLVENRKLAFMGDMDHVQGNVSPTILPWDTDGVDGHSIRRAFLAFNPTYRLTELTKPTLGYTQYYPRMFRQISGPEPLSVYGHDFSGDVVAFEILENSLERLFLVIEPDDATNGKTYGHEIRQLLILACTEVENLLKRVLVSNGYPAPAEDRWTTKDYVKVNAPLRLSFYSSELVRYPEYPPSSPFHGWDPAKPTKGLDWYQVYQKVKHDRGGSLKLATFSHAVTAVAAVHVLLTAQFGFGLLKNHVGRFFMGTESGASRVFRNLYAPPIPLAEQYIPWVDGGLGWQAKDYPF